MARSPESGGGSFGRQVNLRGQGSEKRFVAQNRLPRRVKTTNLQEITTMPTKPSESSHCKYPEICDKTLQCENWLRNHEGCAVHAVSNEEYHVITQRVSIRTAWMQTDNGEHEFYSITLDGEPFFESFYFKQDAEIYRLGLIDFLSKGRLS